MKKKILSTSLAAALLLGGVYTFNAYASDETITKTTTSEVKQTSDVSADYSYTTTPLLEADHAGNHIPLDLVNKPLSSNTISKAVVSEISENPIVDLNALATDYGNEVQTRVDYKLKSGSEIQIFQNDIQGTPESTVEMFKNSDLYASSEIYVEEINGHKAVIVDGEPRKVVNLVSNDHLYVIFSVDLDVSADYLKEVAKQIIE
ncbi:MULTISPECIES: hypothetical protein [Paenibacillus]|uniref:DUF4367 domain-containing protein n=1 Tax=Paenibacillus gallinarum TaxID=2762232 RepID=A0ABR8T064_9BACL|nr:MULTISPECIES: hypothetical protein [Paenibacillus]MBD7968699.1 hypothetical protein [Paenibacillus gallinarum]